MSIATPRYLLKNPPLDPQKELSPVTLALRSPSVSAVTASLPVRSVKEFIDYAKKNPAKVEASGAFVVASTPSEFAAHLKRETEFMGGLIRSLNSVPE